MHSLILMALIPTFLVLPVVWLVVRSARAGKQRGFSPLMSDNRDAPHIPPMQRTGEDGKGKRNKSINYRREMLKILADFRRPRA